MAGSKYIGAEPGRSGEESAALTMQLGLHTLARMATRRAQRELPAKPRRKMQKAPGSSSFRIGSAWTRATRRARPNALGAYAELVQDDTRYEAIADLYLEAGDYEESGRFYDLAIGRRAARTDRLLYMRGTCSMLLGRYAEAVEDFCRQRHAWQRLFSWVCARWRLGDFEQAEDLLCRSHGAR